MTTALIIIAIFCYVDFRMLGIAKHPQAKLYPSLPSPVRILPGEKLYWVGCHLRKYGNTIGICVPELRPYFTMV